MATTIWGKIKRRYNIVRCVRLVSTCSHEGLLITQRYAEKYIPMQILNTITILDGYYHFGKDYAMCVPQIFNPELVGGLVEALFPGKTEEEKADTRKKFYLIAYQSYKRWYSKYFSEYSEQLEIYKTYAMKDLNLSRDEINNLLEEKEAVAS